MHKTFGNILVTVPCTCQIVTPADILPSPDHVIGSCHSTCNTQARPCACVLWSYHLYLQVQLPLSQPYVSLSRSPTLVAQFPEGVESWSQPAISHKPAVWTFCGSSKTFGAWQEAGGHRLKWNLKWDLPFPSWEGVVQAVHTNFCLGGQV